jgi:NADH:ubiquinone oxidoreductase subunit 5 (subunit L)/multisubunit Na+/H+ antiporter MnhA subunit
MSDFPILSLTTFLPLVGAALILFTRGDDAFVARSARILALITSSVVFLLSLYLWFNFDRGNPGFQFEEKSEWMPTLNIGYRMGVDGISLTFVLLSTLLTPICILASWDAIKVRVKEYMISFLVLETLMVGTFCALDFLEFYVFFEGVLIPMYLIIGVWGGALFFAPDNHVPHEAHDVPTWVALLPLVMGIIGIGFAFVAYMKNRNLPAKMAKAFGPIYTFVYRKWLFDELFDATLVRPAMRLGRIFWKGGDGAIIDGLGPDGISQVTVDLARRAGKLQSGYVYHYAFAMMIGVVALVSWYLVAFRG